MAGGHCDVAHGQQAHAASHAGTIHPGHQRQRAGARHAQQLGQVAVWLGVIGGEGLRRLQVGPSAKSLAARAGDDDGTDIAPALRGRDGLRQAGQHAVAHGVAALLPCDGQPQHRSALLDTEFGRCGS